ncbi:hypothetical protein D3C87_1115670 [compost metagenome]
MRESKIALLANGEPTGAAGGSNVSTSRPENRSKPSGSSPGVEPTSSLASSSSSAWVSAGPVESVTIFSLMLVLATGSGLSSRFKNRPSVSSDSSVPSSMNLLTPCRRRTKRTCRSAGVRPLLPFTSASLRQLSSTPRFSVKKCVRRRNSKLMYGNDSAGSLDRLDLSRSSPNHR